MKLSADLHIHSCLSTCGDMEMTPNNIVNMALLKGLDAIAVCDHNSALNLPAISILAEEKGIVLLPGIEVESREEVHVLCYFPTVAQTLDMGDLVYDALPDIPNNQKFFGHQVVMDDMDEQIGTEKRLLIQSTMLSIDDIVKRCRDLGGVPVPAHINRPANSLLACLGFIPPQLNLSAVEVYKHLPAPNMSLDAYHVTHSSDAHRLQDIFERDNYISAESRSAEGILAYLASGKE